MRRFSQFHALALLAVPCAVLAQPSALAHVGGEVMFVSGKAERQDGNGVSEGVIKGMQLLEGDRVRTQADSHVYVRLRDGGLLVVRPQSELKVDLWRYDPAQPAQSRVKYTLDNGVARHVSGQAAKAARDKFRFNTPMAAIGVRGTDFTVLADPAITRVTVQSGGVVVSGLGNGCTAEGLGPCAGPAAVELFAGTKEKVLQVKLGDRRPELIDDPAASPDKSRPAASDEPVAAKDKATGEGVELAELRASSFVDLANQNQNPHPSPGEKPTSPPPPPFAIWGRWASLADGSAGPMELQQLLDSGHRISGVNRYYVLATPLGAAPVELPGAGVGSFRLSTHEGVISDKLTGRQLASTASDGSLKIDFGSRRFETSMNVQAGSLGTTISAKGSVDASGKFRSDPFIYPSVSGLVGGKQGSDAVYLYQRAFTDRYTATGVASWAR